MKITARMLSGQVCEVVVDGPSFGKITPSQETSVNLPWIAPGLIDIQINGFAGVDFNRSISSKEAWQHATQQLYAHGCTGFLIALITNREENYRRLLGDLTSRIEHDSRNCLGFHMEGPWLNPDPGTCGVHHAEWMQRPNLRLLEEWHKTTGFLLKLITMAPEVDLAASLPVIRAAMEKKIAVFLGHSMAMGEAQTQAMGAGAIGWTHLGNAVPGTVPKFENVMLHTLAQSRLFASLIPDGYHLPPHAFRVFAQFLQVVSPSRLLLTTDAMAGAAAAPSGTYTLGEVQAEIGTDGTARLPGSGRLAGSTLTPFKGVVLAGRMAGISLEQAWTAFSTRPAGIIGIEHGVAEGRSADFCLMSPEETPRLLATYHRGKCVYEAV